jgi:MFS family permease
VIDRHRILAAAFLRSVATGAMGVLAGVYLARLGLGVANAGFVIAAGLAGAAVASLIATLAADRIGHRRFLAILALLTAAGGAAVSLSSTLGALLIAAFAGMLNGMGRDRGAALIVEQAILPSTTTDAGRTRAFAWYNVLQDVGHALGSLAAGVPALLRQAGWDDLAALRIAVAGAALLALPALALYAGLGRARARDAGAGVATTPGPPADATTPAAPHRVHPDTRRILTRISALFALDSLGGGFLTAALVSFFFFQRFGVDEAVLGPLFFAARVLNALSHLGAAWLAKRIGLVNTMVFTHMPSSVLLATVAIAPSFPVAAVLFLLREGLVEMDVPTRQSYVMAVVRPEERTLASGVTHLVRMCGWAIAPAFAGAIMQGVSLGAPLVIGAGAKIVYDVLLWVSFRRVKAPEEWRRV